MKEEYIEGGMKPRSPKTIAGYALIVFLGLMGVLTYFSYTLQEMTVANVQTTKPQRGTLERRIQGDGVLKATKEIPFIVPHEARIMEVFVQTGGAVKEGDPLLVLDYAQLIKEKYEELVKAKTDLESKQQAYDWAFADVGTGGLEKFSAFEKALEKAEEKLKEAQINYDVAVNEEKQAQEKLKEAEQIYDENKTQDNEKRVATAQREKEETAARVIQGQKRLESEQKQVEDARQKINGFSRVRDYLTKKEELEIAIESKKKAEVEYEKLLMLVDKDFSSASLLPYDENENYNRTIIAPISATVSGLSSKIGDVVSVNNPLFILQPVTSPLTLAVEISREEKDDIKPGDVATVVVEGRLYDLPVEAVSPSTQNTGGYTVYFNLPKEVGSSGAQATMYFSKKSKAYDVLVPLSALRSDNSGDFVYVINREDTSLGVRYTLERVAVTVAEKDATRAAVAGGIFQGDLLATRGDRTLSSGDRVRIGED